MNELHFRGELYDRLAILELKQERQLDWQEDGEIERYRIRLRQLESEAGIEQELEAFAGLKEINGAIWDLESDLRLGKEKVLGLAEVGRRALAIRDLNSQRVRLKEQLNQPIQPDPLNQKHTFELSNLFLPIQEDPRWLASFYRAILQKQERVLRELSSLLLLCCFTSFFILLSFEAGWDFRWSQGLCVMLLLVAGGRARTRVLCNQHLSSLLDSFHMIFLARPRATQEEIKEFLEKLRRWTQDERI